MLFKPELIDKIVRGEKTQTRRLVKNGEVEGYPFNGNKRVRNLKTGRDKWFEGRSYAVQVKRGGRTVQWCPECKCKGREFVIHMGYCRSAPNEQDLRIKIKRIRHQKLNEINQRDAKAEGFANKAAFLEYFHRINENLKENEDLLGAVMAGRKLPNPVVWVLNFEVVE